MRWGKLSVSKKMHDYVFWGRLFLEEFSLNYLLPALHKVGSSTTTQRFVIWLQWMKPLRSLQLISFLKHIKYSLNFSFSLNFLFVGLLLFVSHPLKIFYVMQESKIQNLMMSKSSHRSIYFVSFPLDNTYRFERSILCHRW